MTTKRKRIEEVADGTHNISSCGYTNIKVVNFQYTWKIRNFSFAPQIAGEALISPKFPAESKDGMQWNLELYPKGKESILTDYVSLLLYIVDPKKMKLKPVKAKIQLKILNGQGEPVVVTKETVHRFAMNEFNLRFVRGFGYLQFVREDFLFNKTNGALPDDTLTVYCEIAAALESESISHEIATPKLLLPDDLQSLLENPEFSDVTISVNGKDFQVHRAILAARSPVFKAMFHADMSENQNRRVQMTDIDEEVLTELLRFIYTGTVLNLDKLDEELLKAADKYALTRLKLMCEEELGGKLSVANAAYIFTLADLHCADQLKMRATQFVRLHFLDVAKTTEWKTMIEEYPRLASEIFNTQ